MPHHVFSPSAVKCLMWCGSVRGSLLQTLPLGVLHVQHYAGWKRRENHSPYYALLVFQWFPCRLNNPTVIWAMYLYLFILLLRHGTAHIYDGFKLKRVPCAIAFLTQLHIFKIHRNWNILHMAWGDLNIACWIIIYRVSRK